MACHICRICARSVGGTQNNHEVVFLDGLLMTAGTKSISVKRESKMAPVRSCPPIDGLANSDDGSLEQLEGFTMSSWQVEVGKCSSS
jgi:hypothetical protein